jgi:hypothetical protein
MGNSNTVSSSSTFGIFREYENLSGKKLIEGIRHESTEFVKGAIETAKRECLKPVASNTNKTEYEDMVTIMLEYLTRKYDVGEGMMKKKTPIEFAKSVDAKDAELLIFATIKEYEGMQAEAKPRVSHAVGEVTKDRAELAKERLKAMRDKGIPGKST